jgi:VWFA-related protein
MSDRYTRNHCPWLAALVGRRNKLIVLDRAGISEEKSETAPASSTRVGVARCRLGVLAAVLGLSALGLAQDGPVFRAGTRLVQIDVVARDKHGPVSGLTKDDFELFVCDQEAGRPRDPFGTRTPCKGRRQEIQVFHAANEAPVPALPPAAAFPQGIVSNRFDSRGAPVSSATVVLLDRLNTAFDHTGYERTEIVKFLRSLRETDRVAVYFLGRKLHVIQDFTDDPEKLAHAIAGLDTGLDVFQMYAGDDSLSQADESVRPGIAQVQGGVFGGLYDQITLDALRTIVRHMAGVPGRKNLVWLKETPQVALTAVSSRRALSLLRGNNIALYPVLVRGVKSSGVFSMTGRFALPMPELRLWQATRDLGASTGGAGFTDAADLHDAINRAAEDSGNTYTLGFYPAESDLDGKLHQLTVALSRRIARKDRLELQYRNEYLAARQEPEGKNPDPNDIFDSPLDATGIGLTAAPPPDQNVPGEYHLNLFVNLADVQLEPKGDQSVGSLRIAALLEPRPPGWKPAPQILPINFRREELQTARGSGYAVEMQITGVDDRTSSIEIVVQDAVSGAAGSLRIPLREKSKPSGRGGQR